MHKTAKKSRGHTGKKSCDKGTVHPATQESNAPSTGCWVELVDIVGHLLTSIASAAEIAVTGLAISFLAEWMASYSAPAYAVEGMHYLEGFFYVLSVILLIIRAYKKIVRALKE